MKPAILLSACVALALSGPALAQNAGASSQTPLQQNGSPNGANPSHAKQPGASNTESGPTVNEGRSSAADTNGAATAPDANKTGQ